MIHTAVSTLLSALPKYRTGGPSPAVGETVEYKRRLPEQSKTYGDITVAVRKRADSEPPYASPADMQIDRVDLVADVPVPAGPSSHRSAIQRFTPVFETLIDLTAFELAIVPKIGQTDMIDITPPVAVGDIRSWLSYTSPPFDRYLRSLELGAVRGRVIVKLPGAVDNLDSKTAAVLRWFVKSLGTHLLHDQFIFLWIALEILSDASGVRINKPYTGPCKHEIPQCPECGKPTLNKLRGASHQAYLTSCGVTDVTAKELWDMRQLMHGAISFDSKRLENLGNLVQPLRAVVAAGLKSRLGKTDNDPPIVAAESFRMHPSMGLGRPRPITEHDIRPLIP